MSISFSSTALSVVGTWMPAQPVGSAAIAADHAAQADERAAADLLQPRADRLGLGCDFLTHEAAMRVADEKLKRDVERSRERQRRRVEAARREGAPKSKRSTTLRSQLTKGGVPRLHHRQTRCLRS